MPGPFLGPPTLTPLPQHEDPVRLFARMADQAAPPHVVRLLWEDSPDAPFELAVLQRDPVLAARIVRKLNTGYYNFEEPVEDLASALQLVGSDEMVNLAMTVYLARLFAEPVEIGSYDRAALWNHLVAVAAVSSLVSRVCGRARPELAFLAGLLHDVGLVLLEQNFNRHFARVLSDLGGSSTPDVEREIYGFDHAALGRFATAHWHLPEAVCEVAGRHHEASQYAGPHADLVCVVAVANYLCSRAGWSSLGVHNVPPPSDAVCAELGLDSVSLSIIWEELGSCLHRALLLARG